MFYSLQVLGKKSPLSRIWIAATVRSRLNRRTLQAIDICASCQDIMEPVTPLALRLSGILMGGVVIVFEKQQRFLHDDVNSLLVRLSAKAVDPAQNLMKSRDSMRVEAITIPVEFPDAEATLLFGDGAFKGGFQFDENVFFVELEAEAEVMPPLNDETITMREPYQPRDELQGEMMGQFEDVLEPQEPADVDVPPPMPPDDDYVPPFNSNVELPDHPEAAGGVNTAEECAAAAGPNLAPIVEEEAPEVVAPGAAAAAYETPVPPPATMKGKARGKRARFAPASILRKARSIAQLDEETEISTHDFNGWLQDASSIVVPRPLKRREVWKAQTALVRPAVPLPAGVMRCWVHACRGTTTGHASAAVAAGGGSSWHEPTTAKDGQNVREEYDNGFYIPDDAGNLEVERLRRALETSTDSNARGQALLTPRGGAPSDDARSHGPRTGGSASEASGRIHLDFEATSPGGDRGSRGRHSDLPNILMTDPDFGADFAADADILPDVRPVFGHGSMGASQFELLEESLRGSHPGDPSTSIDRVTASLLDFMRKAFDEVGDADICLRQVLLGATKGQAARMFYQVCVMASNRYLRVEQTGDDVAMRRGIYL